MSPSAIYPRLSLAGVRSTLARASSRSLLTVGTGLLARRTARRIRDGRTALAEQEQVFANLLARLAQTTYGGRHGLTNRLGYEEFRQRAPLRTYEDLVPEIDRMKRGEEGVLWPGRCRFFAVSSGTTAGRTKFLPVTDEMLAHFRQAGLDSLLFYTARVGHTRVFQGRHLFLGGATALTRLDDCKTHEAFAGDLSGITALNLPDWVEKHLYEPGTDIARMTDWPAKITAIVERTLERDITLLAGIPSWLLILAETMAKRTGGAAMKPLSEIWPHLECLVHGGVPLAPFADELRKVTGPHVNFHEVYPASEGFIAAQDADASLGLRLMTGAGLFFEFLPLREYDETNLAQLGARAVPLADVRVDVDYVLLLTTPAGLTRYLIGDVVRFVSTDIPRLVYVGRTKLQLSAFGEHVIEKELTDALLVVCERRRWTVANFHIAPQFVDVQAGQRRGRHEWWIELKGSADARQLQESLAAAAAVELDRELQRLNEDYEAKRQGGGLDLPVVRLVPTGVFEQWLRRHGRWGGQSKLPRCRSDRQIADELKQIATAIA